MEAPYNESSNGNLFTLHTNEHYHVALEYINKNFNKKINKILSASLSSLQKIEFLNRIELKILNSVVILNKPSLDSLESTLATIDKIILCKQNHLEKLTSDLAGPRRRFPQNSQTEVVNLKNEIKTLIMKKTFLENQISEKTTPEQTANFILSKVRDVIKGLQLGKDMLFPSEEIKLQDEPVKPQPKESQQGFFSDESHYQPRWFTSEEQDQDIFMSFFSKEQDQETFLFEENESLQEKFPNWFQKEELQSQKKSFWEEESEPEEHCSEPKEQFMPEHPIPFVPQQQQPPQNPPQQPQQKYQQTYMPQQQYQQQPQQQYQQTYMPQQSPQNPSQQTQQYQQSYMPQQQYQQPQQQYQQPQQQYQQTYMPQQQYQQPQQQYQQTYMPQQPQQQPQQQYQQTYMPQQQYQQQPQQQYHQTYMPQQPQYQQHYQQPLIPQQQQYQSSQQIEQQESLLVREWIDNISFNSSLDLINQIKINPEKALTWLNITHELQLKKLKKFVCDKKIMTISEQKIINDLKILQKDQIDLASRLINVKKNFPPAEPINLNIPIQAAVLTSIYNEYKLAKNTNNYVSLFGLNKGYTEKEVLDAFKKKFALKLHPDKNAEFTQEAEVLFKLFEGIRAYLISEIKS